MSTFRKDTECPLCGQMDVEKLLTYEMKYLEQIKEFWKGILLIGYKSLKGEDVMTYLLVNICIIIGNNRSPGLYIW